MDINLTNSETKNKDHKKKERVRQAEEKKRLKAYQPTMRELWFDGYTTHTGKHKQGIYKSKLSDADKKKLDAVYHAIENGELGVGVDDMKKFTKAHALRLYKVLLEQQKESTIKKMLKEKPDNYILVNDKVELANMLENLKYESLISVDTETTGLDVVHGEDMAVGIVLGLNTADKYYYIPFGHETGETQLPEWVVINKLKPILENPKFKAVYHNSKYDLHVFRQHGIDARRSFHADTMHMMAVLNENETSFALKNLSTKYGQFFGFEDKSATYEELFGKGGFENTPLDIGSVYGAKDGALTLKFYHWIMEQFERLPKLGELYFKIEKPTTLVSWEMENNGFAIDTEFGEEYKQELQRQVHDLETQLIKEFGNINVNSPQQLQTVLYDQLGLPDVSKKRKTDAKTLKILAKKPQGRGCKILLQYRDLKKLLSTYIEPLPKLVKDDGRLHGQFNQLATVTGRFASKSPNLQNIPEKARKLIKAPDGKVIIGIDFSQIEPRVMAHMAKDMDLQRVYVNGEDLYSTIASNVFNVPIEECGDGSVYRKQSKIIMLAVMYGMSAFSLADMLDISVAEGQKFIDNFYKSYGKVAEFVQERNDTADENGFIETMFNRKRRFIGHTDIAKAFKRMKKDYENYLGHEIKNIWETDLSYKKKRKYWDLAKKYSLVARQSTNATIQGSSADIMKIALRDLFYYIERNLPEEFKLLATVHDEVLIEAPEDISREQAEALGQVMTDSVEIDVPLKVDIEFYPERWGEKVDIDDWYKQEAN